MYHGLENRRAWGGKPHPGAPVDHSHPLARGLRFFASFAEGGGYPREHLLGSAGTLAGNAAWQNSARGPSVQTTGNTPATNYVSFGTNPRHKPGAPMTIWALFRAAAIPGSRSMFTTCGNTTNYAGVELVAMSTGAALVLYGDGAGTAAGNYRYSQGASGAVVAGKWHTMAGVVRSTAANDMAIYVDGIAQTLTYAGTATTMNNAATNEVRSNGTVMGTAGWDGQVAAAGVWDRELTQAEARLLHDDPWAVLAPPGPAQPFLKPRDFTPPAPPTGLAVTTTAA